MSEKHVKFAAVSKLVRNDGDVVKLKVHFNQPQWHVSYDKPWTWKDDEIIKEKHVGFSIVGKYLKSNGELVYREMIFRHPRWLAGQPKPSNWREPMECSLSMGRDKALDAIVEHRLELMNIRKHRRRTKRIR